MHLFSAPIFDMGKILVWSDFNRWEWTGEGGGGEVRGKISGHKYVGYILIWMMRGGPYWLISFSFHTIALCNSERSMDSFFYFTSDSIRHYGTLLSRYYKERRVQRYVLKCNATPFTTTAGLELNRKIIRHWLGTAHQNWNNAGFLFFLFFVVLDRILFKRPFQTYAT